LLLIALLSSQKDGGAGFFSPTQNAPVNMLRIDAYPAYRRHRVGGISATKTGLIAGG